MSRDYYRDDTLPEVFHGTTENTWRRLRYQRKGPAFFIVGRVAYYRAEDVAAWARSQAMQQKEERHDGA